MAAEILTQEDLKQFRLQLLEDLKAHFPQSPPTPKQWLKSSEVRKMLSISPGTLQNLRVNGTLPYKKLGGMIFYKYEDLERLLESDTLKKS